MTIEEYRKQILDEIKRCTSEAQARQKVEEAHRTLVDSNISDYYRRQFWTNLYDDVTKAGLYKTERQEATSLAVIVAAAQAAIAGKLNAPGR